MTHHTPLTLALALTLTACGFATEPDPGHGDAPDAAGAGGAGGGPGERDYGAFVDMSIPPPPGDAGVATDAASPDANPEPDAAPVDQGLFDQGLFDQGLFDQGLFDQGPDGALPDLGPDDLGPDEAFDDLGPEDLGPDEAFDDLGPEDLGPPDADPIDPPLPPDPRCVDACAALEDCGFPANPGCVAECDTEPGPARVLLDRCARDHATARCDPLGFIECADRVPTPDDICAYACDTLAACDIDPGCPDDCPAFAEGYPPDCVEDHLDRDTCDVAAYDTCRDVPDP